MHFSLLKKYLQLKKFGLWGSVNLTAPTPTSPASPKAGRGGASVWPGHCHQHRAGPGGLFTCPAYTCGDPARHAATSSPSTAGGEGTLAQELETLGGGGDGTLEAQQHLLLPGEEALTRAPVPGAGLPAGVTHGGRFSLRCRVLMSPLGPPWEWAISVASLERQC